jgi:predicted MFS family arabinose efflux permease
MDFWSDVFEYFKDRRIAGVFFGTLLLLLILLPAGALLIKIAGWTYVLPGTIVVAITLVVRAILRMRAYGRERYKSSPLSRDELKKARSKLLRTK